MILSDGEIIRACSAEDGGISIEPFEARCIQPASYDLRAGSQAAASSTRERINVEAKGFVEIKPGDFVIVQTFEVIRLDDRHTGRFGLTSGHARSGLIATVGPQIDPGFHGRLTVGLTNLSTRTVTLGHKESFLSAEFHRLEKSVQRPYSGVYQDRTELAPDDLRAVMDREYMSQTEMMRTLETLVSTVSGLQETVKEVNTRLPWMLGVFLALFGTIITAAIALVR